MFYIFRKSSKYFFKSIFVVVPISVTFFDCVGYIAKVEGNSMQPVLNPQSKNHSSDFVFLNKWKMQKFQVERGEIVSLYSPKDPNIKLIKRVIGIEGDWIRTLKYRKQYVQVPPGHCWVEGDHHCNSLDSNSFGPVSLGLISAKATRIVWPVSRWQSLKKHVDKDRKPLNVYFGEMVSWSTDEIEE